MDKKTLIEKLKSVTLGGGVCFYTEKRYEELYQIIKETEELKKARQAIVMAHSYVNPEIIHGIADKSGDSYELSCFARDNKEAKIVIFSAVKFMAETAKIINPEKRVFIASNVNGCSLADSISADMVKKLREKHPHHTFVCYINTTAAVKAHCDVCVTSSNALSIIKRHPNNKIFFLPDKLMAANIANELKKQGIQKEILSHDGTCYVHEDYDPKMIDILRKKNPDTIVLAHPECTPAVVDRADFVGSTSELMKYVQNSSAEKYFMLTECGLATRIQIELGTSNKKFIGTCTLCRYMKSNTIAQINSILKNPENFANQEIVLDEKVMVKAKRCIENMFYYANSESIG